MPIWGIFTLFIFTEYFRYFSKERNFQKLQNLFIIGFYLLKDVNLKKNSFSKIKFSNASYFWVKKNLNKLFMTISRLNVKYLKNFDLYFCNSGCHSSHSN